MAYIEELIQAIDAQLEALTTEIASLEEARAALIANGAASGTVRQASARPAAGHSRQRRPALLEPESAERILAKADGLTAAELAQQSGAAQDQVVTLLRDLEAARRARRTGEGRGTRWHVMSEEEWIRQRAEDLAARQHRS